MNNCPSILLTGYEAAPFFKRGGLADVLGSLPKAIESLGVDARVVIPYYRDIREDHSFKKIGVFSVCFGQRIEHVGIYLGYLPNSKAHIYFLENKRHLSVINIRGKNKKIEQFAFFDLSVGHFILWCIQKGGWVPDLVHCNDWHTGLIPLILNRQLKLSIPTLLTIHNLSYQGKGSIRVLDLVHIKDEDARELKRGTPATEINILGEGIIHATAVSTVSTTYAREISHKIDHDPIQTFLQKRNDKRGKQGKVIGIVNGIDYDMWNPRQDIYLSAKYGLDDWRIGKEKNKKYLFEHFNLKDVPTFCFIGRMASQKGLDVILKVINDIVALKVNLLFLGEGAKPIEASVMRAVKRYPEAIRTEFAYDEKFAHQLYAGCDFILIPSRFEPCGLIQMIAMRYGTLPIASRTGGLIDTIADGKNGFLFDNGSSRQLLKVVKKAVQIYTKQSEYTQMVRMAMQTDFSWDKSAKQYKNLYMEILRGKVNPKTEVFE